MDKKDQDLTDDHGGDVVLNESGTSVSIEDTGSEGVKQTDDINKATVKQTEESG